MSPDDPSSVLCYCGLAVGRHGVSKLCTVRCPEADDDTQVCGNKLVNTVIYVYRGRSARLTIQYSTLLLLLVPWLTTVGAKYVVQSFSVSRTCDSLKVSHRVNSIHSTMLSVSFFGDLSFCCRLHHQMIGSLLDDHLAFLIISLRYNTITGILLLCSSAHLTVLMLLLNSVLNHIFSLMSIRSSHSHASALTDSILEHWRCIYVKKLTSLKLYVRTMR